MLDRGEQVTNTVLHTAGHLDCVGCRRTQEAIMQPFIAPTATFFEATEHWLELRTFPGGRHRYLRRSTLRGDKCYILALRKFFAATLPLCDIHLGHFREYQQFRAPRASALKINQELSTLIRVMRRVGLWTAVMEENYLSLRVEEADIRRAMTLEEEESFLRLLASRERYRLIHWYAILALRTSMSTNEERSLRLGDLNLTEGLLYVRSEGAKNRYRLRTIPLSEDAVWAAQRLVERVGALGGTEPQHYLFPFYDRFERRFLVNKPMTEWGLRKRWAAARDEAGLPWLRQYDLRPTAITRWAESGTPIAIIKAMAGHVSDRMSAHYTHISEIAMRRAVSATEDWRRTHVGTSAARPNSVYGLGTKPYGAGLVGSGAASA